VAQGEGLQVGKALIEALGQGVGERDVRGEEEVLEDPEAVPLADVETEGDTDVEALGRALALSVE
jgi:hypothetical protein